MASITSSERCDEITSASLRCVYIVFAAAVARLSPSDRRLRTWRMVTLQRPGWQLLDLVQLERLDNRSTFTMISKTRLKHYWRASKVIGFREENIRLGIAVTGAVIQRWLRICNRPRVRSDVLRGWIRSIFEAGSQIPASIDLVAIAGPQTARSRACEWNAGIDHR
jgi:hypothetical protein